MFPVTRKIIASPRRFSAADTFAYLYQPKAAQRECDAVWAGVACIITPTAPTIYSIAQMEADPLRLNSNLGYYTNFMNLLDHAATAVPAGWRAYLAASAIGRSRRCQARYHATPAVLDA